MITITLGQDDALIILEPANLQRLKSGHPIQINLPNKSSVMFCFTPDMKALSGCLFGNAEAIDMAAKAASDVDRSTDADVRNQVFALLGSLWETVTPDGLDNALKVCQDLPEVIR